MPRHIDPDDPRWGRPGGMFLVLCLAVAFVFFLRVAILGLGLYAVLWLLREVMRWFS